MPGTAFNPLALRLVLAEPEDLMARGEPLDDVLDAFAELLMRPLALFLSTSRRRLK